MQDNYDFECGHMGDDDDVNITPSHHIDILPIDVCDEAKPSMAHYYHHNNDKGATQTPSDTIGGAVGGVHVLYSVSNASELC